MQLSPFPCHLCIFQITVNILPHIIMGIKTMKYVANRIRIAANLNKFALSSFEITYKMLVLKI